MSVFVRDEMDEPVADVRLQPIRTTDCLYADENACLARSAAAAAPADHHRDGREPGRGINLPKLLERLCEPLSHIGQFSGALPRLLVSVAMFADGFRQCRCGKDSKRNELSQAVAARIEVIGLQRAWGGL